MEKSPEAFRTISEVAGWLGVPTHVLRFWESRFPQVKPVKRAGGRRYYRPADMALLGGIRRLLHDDGMTIRGVQKLLREKGVKHVAALSPGDLEDVDLLVSEARLDGGWPEDVSADAASERASAEADASAAPAAPAPAVAEQPAAAVVAFAAGRRKAAPDSAEDLFAARAGPIPLPPGVPEADPEELPPAPYPRLIARLGQLTGKARVSDELARLAALRSRMAEASAAAE